MAHRTSSSIVALLAGLLLVFGVVWSLLPREEQDATPPAATPGVSLPAADPSLPAPTTAAAEPLLPGARPADAVVPAEPVAMGGGAGPRRPFVVRVLDADGSPVRGARVSAWTKDIENPFAEELARGRPGFEARFGAGSGDRLFGATWESWTRPDPAWGAPDRAVESNTEGSCTLSLPNGVAKLVATQGAQASGAWVANPWAAPHVPIVLTLHPMASLEVVVLDESERPVDEALVQVQILEPWLSSMRRPPPVRTRVDGGCLVELDGPLLPSIVTVCALKGEEWSSRNLAVIRSAMEGPLVLRLGRRFAMQGGVLDPDGEPAVAAVVNAQGPNGEVEAATTDSEGRFHLAVSTPGSWIVGAWSGELVCESELAVVVDPSRGPTAVGLQLLQPGHVTGRFTWPDSTPAAGVLVTLTERRFRGILNPFRGVFTTTTDEEGLFAIGGLHPSMDYYLHAQCRREPLEPPSRTVHPGQDIAVTVERAARYGELVGTVVDQQTGEAIPEFAVRLSKSGRADRGDLLVPDWTSIHHAGGEFRLAPGRMKLGFLWISAAGYAPSRLGPLTFGTD